MTFTGYTSQRFRNRLRIVEGIGPFGGEWAVVQGSRLILITSDKEEAEATAEMMEDE